MRIGTRKESSAVAVLDLEGSLTLAADVTCVSNMLDELLQLGVRRILLSMATVSTVDRAGVGRLLEFREQTVAAGGCLKMAGLNGRVRTALDQFQLTKVFKIYESEKSAIASFFEQSHNLGCWPNKYGEASLDSPVDPTRPEASERRIVNRYFGLQQ